MNKSNIHFTDLPDDILFIIFKKLDNMNVLYSLLDIGNQRLDMIVGEETFTKTLSFTYTTSTNDVLSIANSVLDRFCVNILPRIDYNVKSLIIESGCMERILLAADYPNLTQLKVFNVNDEIVSHYFTVKSSFRHLFQEQITDLILVYKNRTDRSTRRKQYPNGVEIYIIQLFRNLKRLLIENLYLFLSIRQLPLDTCFSSTLEKLNVNVNRFEDCLALLDGRLKQLTTFSVDIRRENYSRSKNYKQDCLPNLKYFSLTCDCKSKKFDTQILPLIRRMFNLEELTLNIMISHRNRFVDGTQINNEILVHLPRLQKFIFHISSDTEKHHLVDYLSSDDIQQSFTNIGYPEVGCIVNYASDNGKCEIFSLPYTLPYLYNVGHSFPSIVFHHVINLAVFDIVPLKHEFFIRITYSFPFLQKCKVFNVNPQLDIPDNLITNNNQLNSIVEYPHLTSLDLSASHFDYLEQFLNGSKTRLPRLSKLRASYYRLHVVTNNFRRDATRLNCARVEHLIVSDELVRSKDFDDYFPVLSPLCFE